jgi:Circadian oscillating protein COP23
MKTTITSKIFQICIATISAIVIPQLAQAQLPTIIDNTAPAATQEAPKEAPKETAKETPKEAPKETAKETTKEIPRETTTASVSKLEVQCQDLKTVVRKGDRQAVMMTWTSNYFGKEFSNAKRCQVVSERLQSAANANGGTFQGLELASGTVNFQPVICALQNGGKKCNRSNMLFTLKPENAADPEAVIEQFFTFAEEGSGSVNESTNSQPKSDRSLGNWERKTFATNQSSKESGGGF